MPLRPGGDDYVTDPSAADRAQAVVVEQIRESLAARRMTADRGVLAFRLRQLADAERSGDGAAVRAAVMEIALAAAEWVAAIDVREGRVRPTSRRSRS